MAIPQFLHQKLQQAFGQEATEYLVSWMESVDSNRADIAELRHEMQIGFGRLESKIDHALAKMEATIERRTAELLKWSFAFWVGAVLAIAALARVLR